MIHGDDGILVHGGTYDNGKDYMLIQGGLKKDRLWLYTFNGHEWILDSIIKCKPYYHMDPNKVVVPFDNGFIFTKLGSMDDALLVFWQNGQWNMNNIVPAHMGNHISDIRIGNDFIVILGGDGDHDRDRIWVYRKYENEWIHDKELFEKQIHQSQENLKVATGNNFFIASEDNSKASVFIWTGKIGLKGK